MPELCFALFVKPFLVTCHRYAHVIGALCVRVPCLDLSAALPGVGWLPVNATNTNTFKQQPATLRYLRDITTYNLSSIHGISVNPTALPTHVGAESFHVATFGQSSCPTDGPIYSYQQSRLAAGYSDTEAKDIVM